MSSQTVDTPDLAWTFGDRIRKIRRTLKLTQGELAEVLGQNRQSVASWESGAVDAPRDVVAVARRLELAYRIPASWTLGLNDEAPRPDGPEGLMMRTRRDSNPQPSDWSAPIVRQMVAA